MKRKAKMEKRKLENPDLPAYSHMRKVLKKTVGEKTKSQIQLIFDYGLGEYMNQRDRGKAIKQLLRCYSINRR